MAFVIYALSIWRSALPSKTSKLRHILRTIARALAPLEEALASHRVESACRVASQKKPAFAACVTALLRWPDVAQPQQFLLGYPIIGDLDHSGVFRFVNPKEAKDVDEWLREGPDAIARIMASKPPLHFEDIFATTVEEQEKGFCSPFLTKAQVDAVFGPGRWRPLERFLIKQADGKKRMIDNARKTLHNSCTSLHETISTTNIDFVANVASDVLRAFHLKSSPLDDPDLHWLDLRVGTDDLPDAYRALPVAPPHQAASIIAIFILGEGWAFTLLWGLAYGLESAVVAFNRFPQLGIAISRRMVLSMCSSYFDDELSLEMVRDHDSSQRGLQLVFTLLGAPPQPSKRFLPTANRHYLGASLHCGDFVSDLSIMVQPKFSTSLKVQAKLHRAIETRTLDSDEAGKLRGDLNWMFSMCAGHLGRFAGPVLQLHQSADAFCLSEPSLRTLQLLLGAVTHATPRVISLVPDGCNLTRIYSDASFENGELRLGWVIFPPSGRREVPVLYPLQFWQVGRNVHNRFSPARA